MPYVSMLPELQKAQTGCYAVPCIDIFEMLSTEGVIAGLEETRAPGIIGIYAHMVEQPNARALTAFIRALADEASVPISLILDHGASFEQCMRALALGFTDVMYDGSRLPLEENIATTRLVVRAAHATGASVEAELGHVGRGTEYDQYGAQRKGFTDPDVVERFVAETEVDALAVAIGTAHGVYKGEPHIDLDLLAEIRRRVSLPLVMHGGSGLSSEQFRAGVAGGISKVNVATELAMTAAQRMAEVGRGEEPNLFAFTRATREAYRERTAHYVGVFGAGGRA